MYRWSLLVCSLLFAYSNSALAQEAEIIYPVSRFSAADLEAFRPAGMKPDMPAEEVLPQPYVDMVLQLSAKHEVSWQLVASLIRAESNFKSRATSNRGARGLMQLTPQTASRYQVSPRELYDPYKNVEAGIRHLKMLIERYYGDLELAIAAYNTGEFTVDHYRGIPPFPTTRTFVRKVLQQYLAAL
jgi:soluble lytic murein transglycosylase-like protein